MATTHLPIQIWLFLFIPQATYLDTKNEGGLKIFISNFELNFLSHSCENCSVFGTVKIRQSIIYYFGCNRKGGSIGSKERRT